MTRENPSGGAPIKSPAYNLTLSQMLTIVHACMKNLHTSAGTYASRINIQPAKPQRGTGRQFSSMGIPPTKNGGRS